MSIKNRTSSLFVLALIVVCAILALRAQNIAPIPQEESAPVQRTQAKGDTDHFPIVDFAAPEPATLEERTRRDAVSKKYDEAPVPLTETYFTISSFAHWANALSAFPVERSQLVIIGEVIEAQAYLSKDTTGVYSEFKIRIDEVLKADSSIKVIVGISLAASRPGGRVRYPSGHITLSFVAGQGMPLVGQKYIFFLTCDEPRNNFEILTGYELRGDHIALLDSPSEHPITKYEGADKKTFLHELQAAINKSSQDGTAR